VGEDTILVTVDRFLPVSYGDEVSVEGELAKPTSFATDFGREFHYDHYLLAKGVEYQISFANVEVLSSGHGNSFIALLLKIKQQIIYGIEQSLPEPQAGLGKGLLLGVKQALGDELNEIFRSAGIIHIVVLSGHNIMLIVGFTLFMLSYVCGRRLRAVIGIGAVVAFALLVGLSATVVRASIMACLLLCAQFLGRTYDIARALLLAAALMVLLNPFILLYDIGFQLSFAATVGLLTVLPKFDEMLVGSFTQFGIRGYFLSTVATQIAVLPLLLYYMGEASIVSIVVNVLVLPIVATAMLTTFGAGVLAIVSPVIAIPFAFLAHLSLSYIIVVATWFASLPFATVAVPVFSVWWVPVLYLLMFAGWALLQKLREKPSSFSDWTIEEEDDVKQRVAGSPVLTFKESMGEHVNGSTLRAPESSTVDDTPIFFR
jgi:competence protein ComEC